MSFFNADTLISGTDGLVLKDLGTASTTPASGFGSIYVNNDVLYFKKDDGTSVNLSEGSGSGSLSLTGSTADSLVSVNDSTTLQSESDILFDSSNSNLTIKSSTVGLPKLELQNLANSTRGGSLQFNLEKSSISSSDVLGSIEFNNKMMLNGGGGGGGGGAPSEVIINTYSNIHATMTQLKFNVNDANKNPLVLEDSLSIFGRMGFNTDSNFYTNITTLPSGTSSSSPSDTEYSALIVYDPSSAPTTYTQIYINITTTSAQLSSTYPTLLRILVKRNSSNEYLTVYWSGKSNYSSSKLASQSDFSIREGQYAEFIYFPSDGLFYLKKSSGT